jgi:hypothetical protein
MAGVFFRSGPIPPVSSALTITKSDATVYSPALRSIYVGVSGDVAVVFASGAAITLKALAAGMFHEVEAVTQIMSTGTTATDILAQYS